MTRSHTEPAVLSHQTAGFTWVPGPGSAWYKRKPGRTDRTGSTSRYSNRHVEAEHTEGWKTKNSLVERNCENRRFHLPVGTGLVKKKKKESSERVTGNYLASPTSWMIRSQASRVPEPGSAWPFLAWVPMRNNLRSPTSDRPRASWRSVTPEAPGRS